MQWIIGIVTAATLVMAGCGKGSESEPGGEQAKPATGEPAQAAEITDQDLPVATDFEEAAVTEISTENYKQELDSLEKEISAN